MHRGTVLLPPLLSNAGVCVWDAGVWGVVGPASSPPLSFPTVLPHLPALFRAESKSED